jgi:SAM-dependent methyltransferase
MNARIRNLFKEKRGIMLDLGCGEKRNPRFIGIDKRKLPGVDIIWDLERFPWPIPDECCISVVASHLVEHIKPWLTVQFFNEVWRIMKHGGKFAIATPYAGSTGYWQDPSHCNGFIPATFQYFDPRCLLYDIYFPSPWEVEIGFPVWNMYGNLECIMIKLSKDEANKRITSRKNAERNISKDRRT